MRVRPTLLAILLVAVLLPACAKGHDTTYQNSFTSDYFGLYTFELVQAADKSSEELSGLPATGWTDDQVFAALALFMEVTVRANRSVWYDPQELRAGDVDEFIEALGSGNAKARIVHTYAAGWSRWEVTVPKLRHYGETVWEVEELGPTRAEGGAFRFINTEAAKFTHCAEIDVERTPSQPGFDTIRRFTKDFTCWYENFHDEIESTDP